MIDSQKIRKGDVYIDGSEVLQVLGHEHIKRGRGQATIRLRVKNIKTGAITEKTYSNKEKLNPANVYKKSAQFLYTDGNNVYFMDAQDYSQFSLSKDIVKEELKYLKDGEKVVVLWLDDQPINIEIQGNIVLKIVDAEDAVAGDTAAGATKLVTLETGVKIQVPLFLKTGDVIKVNPDSGEYVSKA